MRDEAAGRLLRVMLVVTAIAVTVAAICVLGWYRAARRPEASVASLGAEDRLQLVGDLLDVSPGVFRPAFFHPAVSYTLKPGRQLQAWGSTFKTNRLGFRTGPPEKAAGVFRVVFVGDSWTFGLGVEAAEAFPVRLQELARQHSGSSRPVEAWSLALPGYNLLNELAALESLVDTLDPDAVVFCPTVNDIDSTHLVLPNGSLSRAQLAADDFGDPVPLWFHNQLVDSYTLRQRWRRGMESLADVVQRLETRGVPVVVFFTGHWLRSFAHVLMTEAELDVPYVITPPRLASPRWRNRSPYGHPTPQAHGRYARLVYAGLQRRLAWLPLPDSLQPDEPVHLRSEQTVDWLTLSTNHLRRETGRRIDESLAPEPGRSGQICGGIDLATGVMGRGGMVLVRRHGGATSLVVTVEALSDASFIYPLEVAASIPSPSGGSAARVTVRADGAREQRVSLRIPNDIETGAVVDLFLVADRVTAGNKALAPRSLRVVGISQQ